MKRILATIVAMTVSAGLGFLAGRGLADKGAAGEEAAPKADETEIARLKGELAAAKKDLAEAKKKKAFDASKVGRPGLKLDKKPKARKSAAENREVAVKAELESAAEMDEESAQDPEKARRDFEQAAEFMRARTELARKKVIKDLALDEAGTAVFDSAIADMNARLKDSVLTAVELLADEEKISPELTLRLIGDMTATLAEGYDAVGACVGEERRGEISQLQLVEFVQPDVMEPFLSVQDKLVFSSQSGRKGGPGANGGEPNRQAE